MHQTTCFLILDQLEYSPNPRQLVEEHFPDLNLQSSGSVDQLLNSMTSQGNGFVPTHRGQILLTDSQRVVDVVNQSGTYMPMVVLDHRNAVTSPSQFSPSQIVDFRDHTEIIKSVSRAVELSLQYNKLKSQSAKLDTLAERERKIIALASEGVPNKTIAVRLGISIKTVEKNRRIAYSKLAVSSTAEMACLVTFGRFCSSFAQ